MIYSTKTAMADQSATTKHKRSLIPATWKFFNIKGLEYRLVIYVSIGLLIFSLLTGLFTYGYTYRHQLEVSHSLMKQLVRTVQTQAEVAAFARNKEIARDILSGLLTNPLFQAVKIESEEGFKLEKGVTPDIDFSNAIVYPLLSPVDGKERIGSLTVLQDNKQVSSTATKASLAQTILLLLQLLMATVLITWVSRRVISRPVVKLAKEVADIQPGNGFRLEIEKIHIDDEIGMLSKNVNSLINAVELALEESTTARKTAEAATRAKSEFLANMSHEIRTPMNAIMGFSALAFKTDLTSQQMDYLSKIESSAKSLLGIINDILDFSKIEAGKLEMESINFSLNEVINNIVSMFSIKSADKGVELINNIARDVPLGLEGDPLRLGQVLINLITNAIKFTEKGHILVKVELQEIINNRCRLGFSISDTGIGMMQEQTLLLFDAFSQVDSSITRKFGGTGLGLSISKRLVEMMEGKISVESEPGVGSTFTFTAWFGLNLQVSEKMFVLSKKFTGLRVLVVDDNDMVREVLEDMLTSLSFKTMAVASGEAALYELEQASYNNPYDLVLMDWMMPGMDGIEASRRIRQSQKLEHAPRIIMMTAFAREDVMQQADKVGINAFLIKPVEPSLMFDTIMQISLEEKVSPSLPIEPQVNLQSIPENPDRIRGAEILLVEDNPINQQVAMEILKSAGLIVDVANNGREAVEMVEEGAYDLVLMDIQMPVMGGYEATELIRKNKRLNDLPIVAMTAHAMSGAREHSIEAGMDDYVAKPIDIDQLFSVLVRWIRPHLTSSAKDTRENQDIPDRKAMKTGEQKGEGGGSPNLENNGADAQFLNIMKDIPGVDVKKTLDRLNGNHKLCRQLFIEFENKYAYVTESLRDLLNKGDLHGAEHLIHTVKGIAGNLSADDLHAAAGNLEAEISRKNGNCDLLLSNLDKALRPLREALKKWETADEKKCPQKELPVDLEELAPVMMELARFLDRNETSALIAFESLKEIMDGSQFSDTIMSMEKHMDDFDFDSALDLLKKMAEGLNISLKER